MYPCIVVHNKSVPIYLNKFKVKYNNFGEYYVRKKYLLNAYFH